MKSIVKLFYICIIALIIPLLFSCKKSQPTTKEIKEQIKELVRQEKFDEAYEMSQKIKVPYEAASENFETVKNHIKFILDNTEGERTANEIKFIVVDKLSYSWRPNAYAYAIQLSEINHDDALTTSLKQLLLESSIYNFRQHGTSNYWFEECILPYVENFPESFDVEKFKKENVK